MEAVDVCFWNLLLFRLPTNSSGWELRQHGDTETDFGPLRSYAFFNALGCRKTYVTETCTKSHSFIEPHMEIPLASHLSQSPNWRCIWPTIRWTRESLFHLPSLGSHSPAKLFSQLHMFSVEARWRPEREGSTVQRWPIARWYKRASCMFCFGSLPKRLLADAPFLRGGCGPAN